MALTKVTGQVIKSDTNITSHNINSSGIITAVSFSGPLDTTGGNFTGIITATSATFSGNVTIGGTLTYEDVTNIDSVGIITARSTVSIADSIVHTGDINTAIRFPSPDTFTVETGGDERLRITSAGLVNIGGAAVSQSRSLNIGSNAEANLAIETHNDATSETANIRFYKSGNTGASPQVVETDDNIAQLIAYGYDGTDYANAAASIKMSVDGAPGSNDMPGKIILSTTVDGGTTPTERLRINQKGEIVTQGLTGSSFDNDNANTKVVEITGDGTAGEYAVLNISGNQNADNTSVGALKFINRENSNSSTGANANSRQVGLIAAYSVTSDTNAGDDSGGYMQFATKPEAGGISEAMRIDSSGRVIIGGTSTEGHSAADELTISNTTSGADMGITLRSATNGQGAIYFSDGTSGDAEYRGIINYNHTSDFLNFYTAAGERLRIDSSGRVLIGTGTSKSAGSGQYAKLNVEGGVSTTENFTSFSRAEAASAMSANDEVANLTFNDSAGYEFARIQVLCDAAPGATDTPGRIVFKTTADGASSSTNRLTIDKDGDVMMGNLAYNQGNALNVVSNTYDGIGVYRHSADASTPLLAFGKSRGTSGGSTTVVQNDDYLGRILFKGADGDEMHGGAAIDCQVDTTPGNNDMPARLVFSTVANGSTTLTERLRITNGGYVQIGNTEDPANYNMKDILLGDHSANHGMTILSGTSSGGYIMFSDNNGGGTNAYRGQIEYQHNGDYMRFITDAGERMRISSEGKLGIGVYASNPGCYKGMELGSATQNVGLSWGGANYNYTNIWAEYGSGDLWLAGGLRGNGSSSGFVSSYSSAVARSAIQIDAFGATGIHFYTSAALTVDRDSATNLDVPERMRVRQDGLVAIGSADDLGNGHAGCLQVIHTGGGQQTNDCLSYFETNGNDWVQISNYAYGSGAHYHIYFQESGTVRGQIYGPASSNVLYAAGSDYRWKENIVDMTGTEGIDICKKLKPRKFNWIDNRKNTGQINTVDGFIAHEVQEAGVLGAVSGVKDEVNEDGSMKGQMLDYGQMTPVLAAAIKGLIDKVETLEAKVAALES